MKTEAAPVFFLGSGHGGDAALCSLLAEFPKLEIVTDDPVLRALARPADLLCETVEALQGPVGVMAGYRGILEAGFLARKTVLNVHYSLLPRYRGLHSTVWAMLNLETELGLTCHIANEFVDDGPIVHQHRVTYAGATSAELMQQFNNYVVRNLGRVVRDYLEGRIQPVRQDKRQATWVPNRNLDDCLVDFSWPAPRLRALFRALVRPYPLPALVIRGQRLEITAAQIVDRPYFCTAGRVVNVDADGAWIKCADSLLLVQRLLDGNGNEHPATTLLRRGMRLAPRDS